MSPVTQLDISCTTACRRSVETPASRRGVLFGKSIAADVDRSSPLMNDRDDDDDTSMTSIGRVTVSLACSIEGPVKRQVRMKNGRRPLVTIWLPSSSSFRVSPILLLHTVCNWQFKVRRWKSYWLALAGTSLFHYPSKPFLSLITNGRSRHVVRWHYLHLFTLLFYWCK